MINIEMGFKGTQTYNYFNFFNMKVKFGLKTD